MEYNITTVEKAKETLIEIKNNWPGVQLENIDYSKFYFILEHITTNMDSCKQIKLRGLKSIKELIEEPNNEFIKFCIDGSYKNKNDIEEVIKYYRKYNNKISAFFSYENGKKQYEDSLEKYPEMFSKGHFCLKPETLKEWKEKSKTYKITAKVKYEEINFNVIQEKDIATELANNLRRKINNEEMKYCIVEIENTIEPNRLLIEEIR